MPQMTTAAIEEEESRQISANKIAREIQILKERKDWLKTEETNGMMVVQRVMKPAAQLNHQCL